MGKLEVLILIQTCPAVPAQWEGWLVDGRAIYIRARGGTMKIEVSESATEDSDDAVYGEEIYSGPEDGEYDFLSIYELGTCAAIASILDFSQLQLSCDFYDAERERKRKDAVLFMRRHIAQLPAAGGRRVNW